MRTTVTGTLRNEPQPKSHAHPIFEAISNSIHAIEDNGSNGGIEVKLHYYPQTDVKLQGNKQRSNKLPIERVEITDNGIGFTPENYISFQDVNSLYKLKRGGRGKGRFSWLQVFEAVHITSLFKDGDNLARRTFDFSPIYDPEGIGNAVVSLEENAQTGTTVLLQRPKPPNFKLEADVLAQKIMLHFLP